MSINMTHGTMDSLSSPEHRANRLKALREMSGLSREAVKKIWHCKRYVTKLGNSPLWRPYSKRRSTSRKGFQIYENIQCTPEWLLHGIGIAPQFSSKTPPQQKPHNIKLLTQELLYFRHHNSDSIDYHH